MNEEIESLKEELEELKQDNLELEKELAFAEKQIKENRYFGWNEQKNAKFKRLEHFQQRFINIMSSKSEASIIVERLTNLMQELEWIK